ncbi:NfeD family protein [Luteococcus sp. Sow4_B9]|uniref:NfeD family protein n=1 Tax=Luteococcus sp. Sow4_B9 TaxID=3438792 RepID=UPI003F97326A
MTPHEGDFVHWFGQNLWAMWGALGLLLATAEMLTLDLTLLMLASGALAAALTAFVLPELLVVQVLVALAVSAAMLGLMRPTLLRRVRNAPGYRSSISKLVGSEGLAIEPVTSSGGQVKVNGEVWSARTMTGATSIDAGAGVEVYEVDGATLVVYPVHPQLP